MESPRTSTGRKRIGTAAALCGALIAGTMTMMAANPALAAACDAIEYRITSEWGDGHNAAVSLTTGSEDIDGWTVQFDLPGGSQVQNAWNVDWHQSGATFPARTGASASQRSPRTSRCATAGCAPRARPWTSASAAVRRT